MGNWVCCIPTAGFDSLKDCSTTLSRENVLYGLPQAKEMILLFHIECKILSNRTYIYVCQMSWTDCNFALVLHQLMNCKESWHSFVAQLHGARNLSFCKWAWNGIVLRMRWYTCSVQHRTYIRHNPIVNIHLLSVIYDCLDNSSLPIPYLIFSY